MADRIASLRAFYAHFVCARGAVTDPRIVAAFAAVPREVFAGPPPWSILANSPWISGRSVYVQTSDPDPAVLYQDTLVALDAARGINIGEPSLHAHCLEALRLRPGETVLHVGAGSGYYSAILSELVGQEGRVEAFEIDPALAARAARNLADRSRVRLHARSGAADDLPQASAIYVNAGLSQPNRAWLDALLPGGRLLFPLQPVGGFGAMLLVQRQGRGWPARFVTRAGFIACQAPQSADGGRGLAAAFAGGDWGRVRALRLDSPPDSSCWFRGDGWWLSTDGEG